MLDVISFFKSKSGIIKISFYFFVVIFCVSQLTTCIFLIFYNEPELGAEIDSGMALTPLSSSIGRGLNPRPSKHEPSAPPLVLVLVNGLINIFKLPNNKINCDYIKRLSVKKYNFFISY
jgi:hypothetical protein